MEMTDIVRVVDLANSFREMLGAEQIDDLPPGAPRDANQCILAKAFNFDASFHLDGNLVLHDPSDEQRRLAKKWAEDQGFAYVNDHHSIAPRLSINVPKWIVDFARDFDDLKLPDKYYSPGYR